MVMEMAMAFLTMPTKWATMVIITANLWRNRDLLDLKISDLILELPGQATNMNKNKKSITNSTYSHSYYRSGIKNIQV